MKRTIFAGASLFLSASVLALGCGGKDPPPQQPQGFYGQAGGYGAPPGDPNAPGYQQPGYQQPGYQQPPPPPAAPAAPAPAATVECGNCHGQVRQGAKFCDSCGTPMQRHCTNCNADLSASAKFCAECGTPASPPAG